MLHLSQPLAHIEGKLFIDGETFDIEHFNVRFNQPVDYKGQPQHETKGGHLILVLSQVVDDNLRDWAKRSTKLKSGEITFETGLSNPVLKVIFSNAYCIELKQDFDSYSGIKTTMVLYPEKIDLNGVKHDNRWNI